MYSLIRWPNKTYTIELSNGVSRKGGIVRAMCRGSNQSYRVLRILAQDDDEEFLKKLEVDGYGILHFPPADCPEMIARFHHIEKRTSSPASTSFGESPPSQKTCGDTSSPIRSSPYWQSTPSMSPSAVPEANINERLKSRIHLGIPIASRLDDPEALRLGTVSTVNLHSDMQHELPSQVASQRDAQIQSRPQSQVNPRSRSPVKSNLPAEANARSASRSRADAKSKARSRADSRLGSRFPTDARSGSPVTGESSARDDSSLGSSSQADLESGSLVESDSPIPNDSHSGLRLPGDAGSGSLTPFVLGSKSRSPSAPGSQSRMNSGSQSKLPLETRSRINSLLPSSINSRSESSVHSASGLRQNWRQRSPVSVSTSRLQLATASLVDSRSEQNYSGKMQQDLHTSIGTTCRQNGLAIPTSPRKVSQNGIPVELIQGTEVSIEREELKKILKEVVFDTDRIPDNRELARRLIKAIVGIPQLTCMTPMGNCKSGLKKIPESSYNAVYDYVSILLPEYTISREVYRIILSKMCYELRKPRR